MIRERKNNALAGVTVLLGALVISFGAFRPLVRVQTAGVGLDAGAIDFNVVPRMSIGAGDMQGALLVLAALIGLCALLLIATRVRGFGILWRLFGLVGLLVPTAVTYYLWTVVQGDSANSSLVQKVGLVTVAPGEGLYALTAGVGIALIGLCIPASRRSEQMGAQPEQQPTLSHQRYQQQRLPTPSTTSQPQLPPGWYRSSDGNGQRYWDGQRWV